MPVGENKHFKGTGRPAELLKAPVATAMTVLGPVAFVRIDGVELAVQIRFFVGAGEPKCANAASTPPLPPQDRRRIGLANRPAFGAVI